MLLRDCCHAGLELLRQPATATGHTWEPQRQQHQDTCRCRARPPSNPKV